MKPKCKCGLEMIVIEYKGYYEKFKFWGFSNKCKCTKKIRVRDYRPDNVSVGAFGLNKVSESQNKFKKRLLCSCGLEFDVIKYSGYYDEFNYWKENIECKCMPDVEQFEADEVIKGAFS